MTTRAQDFWESRFQASHTPWERGQINPAFIDWRASGELAPCRILVPGAGRSPEPAALLEAGFDVVALDLAESAIAVRPVTWVPTAPFRPTSRRGCPMPRSMPFTTRHVSARCRPSSGPRMRRSCGVGSGQEGAFSSCSCKPDVKVDRRLTVPSPPCGRCSRPGSGQSCFPRVCRTASGRLSSPSYLCGDSRLDGSGRQSARRCVAASDGHHGHKARCRRGA